MAAEALTRATNGVAAPPPGPINGSAPQNSNAVKDGQRTNADGNNTLAQGNSPARQISSDRLSNAPSNPSAPTLKRNLTTKSLTKAASGPAALLQLKQQHSSSTTNISAHSPPLSSVPIDPLSQQILHRTNTEKSLTSKLRTRTSVDEPGPSGTPLSSTQEITTAPKAEPNQVLKPNKEKKKGVSFFSRIIGNKKKDDESNDDVSELGERRTTGLDAEVFGQPIGFIPRFPPPPKYIRVRAQHKKVKDFNRLFMAQELKIPSPGERQDGASDKQAEANVSDSEITGQDGKAIWKIEFSKDGRYLAVAGQDKKVRVWSVISNPEDREAHEIEEETWTGQPLIRLNAPVFKNQVVREYEGHTGSIVDISWSKNNFLLSTALDKTVRLWHVKRDECLCCFKHSDIVTSIEFHPKDDRFFVAGSLDTKLRLWSIPDKNVAYVATTPDLITAVAFTPDGKHTIAGCLNGQCVIYETDGLRMVSQIHVRSARGRNAKGSKITGIDTIFHPPGKESGIVKILITSNDSRIRLYNFRDRTLEAKFRGNENSTSQIRASFSSDGRYIICGSEDQRVYIWPVSVNERLPEKRPMESFEAHSSMVTTAIMAPVQTKQILGSSGDLLYDLCNPPPITLVSQTGSVASRSVIDNNNTEAASSTPRVAAPSNQTKQQESPAYVARSSHSEGNIIVTADYNGSIKVFRQDCGYHRRPHESWDTGSTFSKRLLGRTNSVSTRRSVLSIGKESLKTPSERILSWRNSVAGSRDNGSVDNLRTQGSRTRSVSPNRSFRKGGTAPKADVSEPAKKPVQPSTISKRVGLARMGFNHPFSGAVLSESQLAKGDRVAVSEDYKGSEGKLAPNDPLFMEGNQSYMFWDESRFASQVANRRRSIAESDTDIRHVGSLTSEDTLGDADSSPLDDGEEELSCPRCRQTNFRATRTRSGDQRLKCVQCGTFAS